MSDTSQLTPISARGYQDEGEPKAEEPNAAQVEPSEQELEEDLFGGEDDEGSAGELLPDEHDHPDPKRDPLEYDEDLDAQPATSRPLNIAEAPLPNLPFPKPSDGKHWDLRIPNFLSFHAFPFSDEEFLSEGADSGEKEGGENVLTDQNAIRWRWRKDPQGNPVKQSNARIICWEDGSQSLQVGSELFDMISTVDGRQSNNNTTTTASQQQQGASQGLTYLFAQHSELKLLEAQASITGQITLRPYSLDSLTHRIIVANRSLMKANSLRQTSRRVITKDPEQEKINKELEEERKLKDMKKQDAKLARQNSRQTNLLEGGSRGAGGVRKRRFNAPLLSDEGEFDQVDEEEEEEDYEEEMEEEEDEKLDRDHRHTSHHFEPQLTELELADQRLEEQELDRKKRNADRERHVSQKPPKPAEPVSSEPKITKRKLIIASDDED